MDRDHPRARHARVGLFALLALSAFPTALCSQLRRDAFVQPIGMVQRGDFLVGLGVAYRTDVTFALSGLGGDLTSVAAVHLAYGIGSKALFEVRGAVRQILSIDDATATPSVPLDSSVDDGVTGDSGDFELAFSFLPIGGARGFSAGGHVGVKLPNSNETKGIGPNTTDVTIGALFSWGARRWRASGWAGVGILEAPARSFEQNDVFAYAFEWLWDTDPQLRVAVGVRGRASTRGRVPIGTEDLGELRFGVEWLLGRAAVDVGIGHGYTRQSGDLNLTAGIAWRLAR